MLFDSPMCRTKGFLTSLSNCLNIQVFEHIYSTFIFADKIIRKQISNLPINKTPLENFLMCFKYQQHVLSFSFRRLI